MNNRITDVLTIIACIGSLVLTFILFVKEFIGFIGGAFIIVVFGFISLLIIAGLVKNMDTGDDGHTEFIKHKVSSMVYIIALGVMLFFVIRGYITIINRDESGWNNTWKLVWEYGKGYALWGLLYIPIVTCRYDSKRESLDSIKDKARRLL